MFSSRRQVSLLLFVITTLFVSTVVGMAGAQGLQTSPYGAADAVRRGTPGGLDLAPSNPLALPGSAYSRQSGSDTIFLSSEMLQGILPLIPNLQFGYLYDFGNSRVSSGRFTADYLLPLRLSPNSMIFGEAHTEFQDFWKTTSFNNRVDMSFGGGYRTFLKRDTLLGVNGFYDTSRLGGTWYSSGSVGLEMAALIGDSDAIDLNFNWYGQIFNSNVISNAFRYGPSNFDVEAGYSHELWNGGPDFRVKMTGYKFDIGSSVYGWNTGAELKSRDGMFVLKYDVGHDQVNRTYQTVGGFVNMGFQLENLLKGENPFTMPEPIFRSPRSLRHMLTQKVKRNWHQPSAVIPLRQSSGTKTPQVLLATRTTVAGTVLWSGGTYGYAIFFNEGAVPASIVSRLTSIVVTVTLSSNTSDQPLQAVIVVGLQFWAPDTISFAPGETGTRVFVFPAAMVANIAATGTIIRAAGVGVIPWPTGTPPSGGTTITFSTVTEFYGN